MQFVDGQRPTLYLIPSCVGTEPNPVFREQGLWQRSQERTGVGVDDLEKETGGTGKSVLVSLGFEVDRVKGCSTEKN